MRDLSKKILLSFIALLFVVACDKNPVRENRYSDFVSTEFYELSPSRWMVVEGSQIQWYQEFRFSQNSIRHPEEMGVMCYYLNQFDAWEALPSTRIFWDENNVVYSDELWFSHNLEYLYIDYRNTVPGVANPPKDKLLIKAVYYDNKYIVDNFHNDINWYNYDEVKEKLSIKD